MAWMFWLFWYGLPRASETEFRSLRIWNSRAFPPESSRFSNLSADAVKVRLRSSVTLRAATMSSSSGALGLLVIGPALTSRSFCRALARSVAFLARSERLAIWASCCEVSSEVWMRRPPRTSATMTGSASSAISLLRMRQLRMASRLMPLARRRVREDRSLPRADFRSAPSSSGRPITSGVGSAGPPGAAACWGAATGSRDSGSPAPPLPLLKRPCTGVATSGPGVPPRRRSLDGVEFPSAPRPVRESGSPGWSTPYPRSVAFQHSRGIPTRASGAHRAALPNARGISRSVRQPDLNTAFFGHSSDTCQAEPRST